MASTYTPETTETRNGLPSYPRNWSDLSLIRQRIEVLQASDQSGAIIPYVSLSSWYAVLMKLIHRQGPTDESGDKFYIESLRPGQPLTRPDLIIKQLSPESLFTLDKVMMVVWLGQEQGEVGMKRAKNGVRKFLEQIVAGPEIVGLAVSTCTLEASEMRRVLGTAEGFMEGGAMDLLSDEFLDWLRKALVVACQ